MREWSTLRKLMMLKASNSGTPTQFGPDDIVTFTTKKSKPLQELTVTMTPIQDLHGYDSPWAGGAGKNKLENLQTTQTISDVKFTVNPDGSVLVNGTATDLIVFTLNESLGDYLEDGISYYLNGSPTNLDTSKWKLRVYNQGDNIDTGSGVLFTFDKSIVQQKCDIVVYNGTTMSNVLFKPMIRLASVTDATFAPYENLCPIYGRTGASACRAGKNLFDISTYPLENGTYVSGSNGIYATTIGNSAATLDYIPFEEFAGKTITLNKRPNGSAPGFAFYTDKSEQSFISGYTNSGQTGNTPWTVTVPDGTKYMRFSAYKGETDIQIELGSTSTEYEPYQGNLFSVEFPALGKNIFPDALPSHAIAASMSSENTINEATNARVFAIPVEPNTDYTLSADAAGVGVSSIAFGDKLPAVGDTIDYRGNMTNRTTWTQNSGNHIYLLVTITRESDWENIQSNHFMIEKGSSKTAYEPYTNTVYSGTVDIVTGVLTVGMAMVDMGTLAWVARTIGDNSGFIVYGIPNGKETTGATGKGNALCSIYPIVENAQVGAAGKDKVMAYGAYYAQGANLYVVDSDYATAADFKTAMAGVQLLYELATPIEIQLTPQEVMSLVGQNVVWSPDGEVTVIARV